MTALIVAALSDALEAGPVHGVYLDLHGAQVAIGFDDAAILDGGFDKWAAEGRPTEAGDARYAPARLAARCREIHANTSFGAI